jgi:hypothetical protein
MPVRLFPDGMHVILRGQALEQPLSDPVNYLFVLDVAAGKLSRFGSDRLAKSTFPNSLAVTPDGRSVILAERHGDLSTIIAADASDASQVRTLFQLTDRERFRTWPDGSIYINQQRGTPALWRFCDGAGAESTRVSRHARELRGVMNVLHTPEGRTAARRLRARRG